LFYLIPKYGGCANPVSFSHGDAHFIIDEIFLFVFPEDGGLVGVESPCRDEDGLLLLGEIVEGLLWVVGFAVDDGEVGVGDGHVGEDGTVGVLLMVGSSIGGFIVFEVLLVLWVYFIGRWLK
jgi:hypothetical protein